MRDSAERRVRVALGVSAIALLTGIALTATDAGPHFSVGGLPLGPGALLTVLGFAALAGSLHRYGRLGAEQPPPSAP